MEKQERESLVLTPVLAVLVGMYVVTGVLLLILAAVSGKFDLTDSMVSIAIIVIYIISCFLGGLVIGKKMKTRRYLWGLCMGICYFLVMLLGNIVVNRGLDGQLVHFMTTAALCTLSGMAGGMVS